MTILMCFGQEIGGEMNTIEAFHLVTRINQVVLQIARDEKPTGSWPQWAIAADKELTAISKDLRVQAKALHGKQVIFWDCNA